MFEKSPSRGDFLRFWRLVFRFIHLHHVHSLFFACFLLKIVVLDVLDVLECMYVMYKDFFVKGVFLVYYCNFRMYLRSTSMYIGE